MAAPTRPLPLPGPRPETAAERDERRRKLRNLDRCLDLLETAMEHDRTVIDPRDAGFLAETTLMVHADMAVADAIEVVLLLQEAYMLPVLRPLEPLRRR